MGLHCGYVGAVRCSDGPTTGAKSLMAWFLGGYGARGGTNLGIYLCREIAGSGVLSVHAEGRACDLGIPAGASWGQGLCDALVARSRELGVQCVIYRGRIWSGAHCMQGWRPYNGADPHNTHAHVELDPASAGTLTVARINEQMGASMDPAAYNASAILRGLCLGQTEVAQRNSDGTPAAKVNVNALVDRLTAGLARTETVDQLQAVTAGLVDAIAGLANRMAELETGAAATAREIAEEAATVFGARLSGL